MGSEQCEPTAGLNEIGIGTSACIEGKLTILRKVSDAPVVFLFPEHHDAPACIQQNVRNAKQLRSRFRRPLVGVESHQRGGALPDAEPVNNHPEFAEECARLGCTVIGVEDPDPFYELQMEASSKSLSREQIRAHPLNLSRSKAFLRELAAEFQRRGNHDCMLLNAGGQHVSDLVGLIESGVADELANRVCYTYVLVMPTAHPGLPRPNSGAS